MKFGDLQVKEIRQLNKRFVSGMITLETYKACLDSYETVQKLMLLEQKTISLCAKHGEEIKNKIAQSALLGDVDIIDLAIDFEVERISCPDLDKIISRAECLDYSGETAHVASCSSCEQFPITRKLLLPEK